DGLLKGHGTAVWELNVLDAINMADCIVTINSTVGFEAALRQKPVLVLGDGILSGQEFVSSYQPGQTSGKQLAYTIQEFRARKQVLFRKVVAFADFLDSEYYAYHGDVEKVDQLLMKFIHGLPIRPRTFNRREIAVFCASRSTLQMQPEKGLREFIAERIKRRLWGKVKSS
ncbi:MAG: hypothetical protein MN733_38530, partial [Nitrososphaera sp.]|nr:hypothetical protein [Nitrososphaera sp.]